MLGVVLLFQLIPIAVITAKSGRPPLRMDSAIFQYAGWYMTNGATLYTDIWEVKLPLAYQIPAILAHISGGSIMLHHALNIALTVFTATACCYLIALHVEDLTENLSAAGLAAAAPLLLTGFFYLPAHGFKSKFYVALTALAAFYLSRHNRPALAGVSAAASVGFYHAAVIVPVVTVILSYQYDSWRGFTKSIIGGLGFGSVMIAPVVMAGAGKAMIVETVIVFFTVESGKAGIFEAIFNSGWFFGFGSFGAVFAAVGIVQASTRSDWRDTWWVTVTTAWFVLIVLFADFDNYPDLIPGLAIAAIGLGLFYDQISKRKHRQAVSRIVVACIVMNLLLMLTIGGIGGIYSLEGPKPVSDYESKTYNLPEYDFSVERPDVRYLYWSEIESETCHIRLSKTELRWIQKTGGNVIRKNCGDWRTGLNQL